MINYIVIFLLPFIQLGFSYYLSVQTFLLTILLSLYKYKTINIIVAVLFLCLFFIKYAFENFNNHDILLTFREYFSFLLIVLSTAGFKKIDINKMYIILKILFLVLSFIVILQYIAIHFFSALPILPIDWYISNQDTLMRIELSLEHNTRLRPVGFYGEPSYVATVILILNFLLGKYKINKKYDLLTLLTLALIQSLTGFIVFFAILFFRYKNYIFIHKRYLFIILVFIMFSINYLVDSEIYIRIHGLLTGDIDPSTVIRLYQPFYVLQEVMNNHNFFGISNSNLMPYLSRIRLGGIDNGLYNMIISYGLGSVFILLYFFYKIKNIGLVIIFLLLIQANGNVFSFDKVILFSLFFGISKNIALQKNIIIKNLKKINKNGVPNEC